MKKVFIIASLLLAGFLVFPDAQAQTSVRKNIVNQPDWGPTGHNYVSFYYFPDYNIYFDLGKNKYIVLSNNRWTYVNAVPARIKFNAYNSYKVIVNQSKPYLYNKTHQREYAKYKGQGSKQPMIRDSREEKYYESKQHPKHNEWQQNQSGRNDTKNQPAEKQKKR